MKRNHLTIEAPDTTATVDFLAPGVSVSLTMQDGKLHVEATREDKDDPASYFDQLCAALDFDARTTHGDALELVTAEALDKEDEDDARRGAEVVRVLGLAPDPEHPDRVETTQGNKTALGLARTLRHILQD